MGNYSSLAVVGEELHQVFINEDPQFQIFPFLQFKGGSMDPTPRVFRWAPAVMLIPSWPDSFPRRLTPHFSGKGALIVTSSSTASHLIKKRLPVADNLSLKNSRQIT
jgi:hypothetical protein